MVDKKSEKPAEQLYEVSYHLIPTVAEAELDSEVAAIRGLIEKAGGFFALEEWPKHFALSYTLSRKRAGKNEKFDTSYFGWIQFNASAESAEEVNTEMSKLDNVLRYLVVKTEKYVAPSKPRSILNKDTKKVTSPTDKAEAVTSAPASKEDMDKEIDKLVVG